MMKTILVSTFLIFALSAQPVFAACSSPAASSGVIEYDTGDDRFEYCDDTSWLPMCCGAGYTPNGINFDGTSDYLVESNAPTGVSNGKMGTISFWYNLTTGTADQHIYSTQAGRVYLTANDVANSGDLIINAKNTSGTIIMSLRTLNQSFGTGWHHFMASWDLSDPSKQHLYIDGVSDRATWAFANDNINYANNFFSVGSDTAGNQKWEGDIADFWFDMTTYVDLSIASNREKFYNSGAVDLGSIGANPTGSSPDIYNSGAVGLWHSNKGTAGGFTENGVLTDASTNPPSAAGCTKGAGVTCMNNGSSCSKQGEMKYDSGNKVMVWCDGSNEFDMAPANSGSGGCTSPSAFAGALDYNTSGKVYRFCDGDGWVDIGK